jgi:PAS domain S-box-containing protein
MQGAVTMGVRSPLLKAHGDDFAWSLLDASPDATLVVAGSGEIVFVSDHAGELFGFAVDDLLGRPVEDLLPAAFAQVHRAHRTRYRARPTVRTMGAGLDLWARRADGSEFPVEISLSPLRLGDDDFAVAAVRDISERVESEAQLHRVLRTLDATDDGIFIFDAATMEFSFVNEGAVRLTGYDRAELLAMTPRHLNPETSEAEYRRLIASLLVDRSSSIVRQATMVRKDGSEVAVEKTYRSAFTGRDKDAWIITLARDVTARLAQEADLRESQRALHDAEKLVAVVEDRERIARDLHDTVIQRLFGEGLNLQSMLPLVDARAAARLRATIDGLDQTIKELRMAVFFLQSPTSAPAGLRGRLFGTVTDARSALGFEPRLQFDGPIDAIEDRVAHHLIPVLREALSNVARHAHARSARVTLIFTDHVTLTVSDDGVGVPDEVLGGRGIRNLGERARLLGGESTLTNQPGGGSLLTWRVPASIVPSLVATDHRSEKTSITRR